MAVQAAPTIPTHDVTLLPGKAPGANSLIAGDGFPLSGTVRGHGTFNAILRHQDGVTSDSHIFASVSELNADGFRFQGDATCRVNGVSPFPNRPTNGILVRLTVDFPRDLDLRIDYLLVNG